MAQSRKWQWNSADTQKFLKETLKVLAPYLIVIIPVVIDQLPKDWAYAATVIFLLQRARSVLEILKAGK